MERTPRDGGGARWLTRFSGARSTPPFVGPMPAGACCSARAVSRLGRLGLRAAAMPDAPAAAPITAGWKFWAAVVFLAPLALYLAWKDRRHG